MIFNNFKIHAIPYITDAYCSKCHNSLKEVSNGLLSRAMYCPVCESVFMLKLVKVPNSKLSKEFIKQCREETKNVKK